MRPHLLILLMLLVLTGIVWGQPAPAAPDRNTPTTTTTTITPPKGVRQYVEQQTMIIEVKSQIPDVDVFQDKSDTYQKAGDYGFTFNLETVKENSDILLNKWLKESK